MKHVFDTIIIGGGAIGTASLYFLAKSGRDVLLIEKGGLANGSSSRCDSNVHVGDSKAGIDTDMIVLSQNLFRKYVPDLAMDVEWRDIDSMYVLETEAEKDSAKKLVEEKEKSGVPIRLLDVKETLDEEPNLAKDIAGGILIGNEGMVNPLLLCMGLAGRAKQYGGEVKTHTEVTGIDRKEDGYIVHTLGENFYSVNILIAAGIWSPEIGRMIGLSIPVFPRQGQILVTEEAKDFVKRTITEYGYIATKQESQSYVRQVPPEVEEFGIAALIEPTESGTMLIGSSRRFCGFDTRTDDRVIRAMANRAVRFWPKLSQMNMIRTYAGLRPYTEDHKPIISDTFLKGCYIATGHEGGGIAMSMVTGQLIEEIINATPTSVDVKGFSFSRFQNIG